MADTASGFQADERVPAEQPPRRRGTRPSDRAEIKFEPTETVTRESLEIGRRDYAESVRSFAPPNCKLRPRLRDSARPISRARRRSVLRSPTGNAAR